MQVILDCTVPCHYGTCTTPGHWLRRFSRRLSKFVVPVYADQGYTYIECANAGGLLTHPTLYKQPQHRILRQSSMLQRESLPDRANPDAECMKDLCTALSYIYLSQIYSVHVRTHS